MKWLRYYLRGESEGLKFNTFGIKHILSLIFVSILAVLFYRFLNMNILQVETVAKIMAIILIIQQVSLFIWYMFSNGFPLDSSLPLHICRIVIIISIVALLTGSKTLFSVVYFWGGVAAVWAFAFPDFSGFKFPHHMYVSYYIGHFGIIATIVMMFVSFGHIPTILDLLYSIKLYIMYVLCITPINLILKSNYGKFMEPPPYIADKNMSKLSYYIIFNLSFIFLQELLYLILR